MEHFEKSQDFKENVMKYWIFCDDSCDQEEVQNDCLARLSCETAGFIWQQEPLNLKAVKDGKFIPEELLLNNNIIII